MGERKRLVDVIAGKWAVVLGIEDEHGVRLLWAAVAEGFDVGRSLIVPPIPPGIVYDVRDFKPHTSSVTTYSALLAAPSQETETRRSAPTLAACANPYHAGSGCFGRENECYDIRAAIAPAAPRDPGIPSFRSNVGNYAAPASSAAPDTKENQ
jgi:hypothetical protein